MKGAWTMNAPLQFKDELTLEEFLTLPDHDHYELVDGHLVETNVSNLSSWVGGQLAHMLANHCQEHHLGWVFPSDTLIRCFPWNPKLVRKPDVSFLQTDRMRPEIWTEGFITEPPDLAVEVISPNDLATDLFRKLAEYLRAGVRLIWLIDPQVRQAQVFRPDGSGLLILEEGTLDGETIIPGFHVALSALWPPLSAQP